MKLSQVESPDLIVTDTLPGRSRTHLAGLLIVAAVLAVAACGGDSTTGGNGTTTQISANAVEFSFSPDSWVVAAGVEVTLRLQNDDSLLHTWVVLASPIELEGELSEDPPGNGDPRGRDGGLSSASSGYLPGDLLDSRTFLRRHGRSPDCYRRIEAGSPTWDLTSPA